MFVQGLIIEWLEMKIKEINKMSKKFTYTKFTKYHYCEFSDEWEQDGVEFEYEVENEDLAREIVKLLQNDGYFENKETEELKRFILDFDLVELLAEQYEDSLKDIFQKEALEFYED